MAGMNTKRLQLSYRGSTSVILTFFALILVFVVLLTLNVQRADATAGINQRLNFQGRLFNNLGAVIPDGDYNVEFKIVQDGDGCNPSSGTFPCGGTVQWTETRTGTDKMTVRNGYFSVELGSVSALPTTIWNQDTLWLSINMGGTGSPSWDGEMKPLKRLSASPYALNSAQLGGLAAANFVQLAQGLQTDTSTSNTSISVNKTGATASILDLQRAGVSVFNVANNGTTTIQNTSGAALFIADTSNTKIQTGNVEAISAGTLSSLVNTTVDSTGNVGSASSIKIGADGFARISSQDNGNQDLRFAQCTNAACTTKNLTTVDSAGSLAQTTSLDLGTDGYARISYFDGTNQDLKFAQCTNADCSSSNITSVDTTGQVGDYSSIAMATDGFARISYYDSSNGNLKFVQCTNASCSTNNVNTVDSAANNVGTYSSMALGSDGFARISYYDSTSGDLKFAQCTNASCSTSNINTVDTTGDVGRYTSIAIGTDGFARISYIDNDNHTLKFVQCTNASCSTNVLSTLDSSSLIGGSNTSLAVGSDGNFQISYIDASNSDLKLSRPPGLSGSSIGTATAGYNQLYVKGINADAFTLSGITGSALFKNISDSTSAFQIQNAAGTGDLLIADTTTNRIAIGKATAGYTLDVGGDINTTGALRINGTPLASANLSDSSFIAKLNTSNIFTDAISFTPTGTNGLSFTGDNDSNIQITNTLSSDVAQNALKLTVTDNANASTNLLYGLNVTNADNGTNTGVPDALAYLANANAAETVPDGLLVEQTGAGTLTNGLEVKRTAGTITTGLLFTGTGYTNYINTPSSTFKVDGSGNVTAADVVCASTNCISLASETSGNYVASTSTSALTGLTGGSAGSEGAALTLGLDYSQALAGNVALSANAAVFGQSGLVFEGSAADLNETFLAVANPTSDHTFTFPDVSTGDVCISNIACIATSGTAGTFTGNYVASVATSGGLTGGAAGSNAAALSLSIDQAASLTWTGTETFNGTTSFTPTGATSVTINGDSDSGLVIAGATTDITTGSGQDLTLLANGAGVLKLGDFTTANGVLYVSATDGTVSQTAASTGTQCLQTASAGSAPVWGSCGSSTLAAIYTAGTSQADSTLSLNSSGLGLVLMDNATPISGNLFTVKEHTTNGGSTLFGVSTAGLTVVDTSGNNGLIFDSSAHELKIYDSTAANFASITATTNTATFKSNTGTTVVGGGSGNISMSLTNAADVLTFQKSASLSGAYSANDFTITRNLTQSGNSSSGSAILKVEDTSSASSAANIAPDVLQISQSNGSAGGNLINAKAGGTSKLSLSTAGLLTFNGDAFTDLTGSGLTVASNALTINLTSSGTTGSTSSNSGLEVAAGGLTLLKGCTDGQGMTYTDASGWACASVATDLQSAYTNSSSPATITTTAGKGIVFKAGASADNFNLFQMQDSGGVEIANVNTLGATSGNLIGNPSFENNANGWVKKGSATVAVTSSSEVAPKFEDRELKVVTTATANDGVTYVYQFPAAGTYSFSFWAKSTASTGANISFGYRVNTTTGDVNCLAAQTLTTTWTQFTCSNVSVSGTINDTAPTIGIYVKQSDATLRTIYLDGVTMVQSATALSYDTGGLNFQIDSTYSNITLNGGNTGVLQPWRLSTNVLTTGCGGNREQAGSVTANGYLYVVGGYDGTNAQTTVCYAKIAADGNIGAWATTTVLPAVRRHLSVVAANGYLYAIGGADTTGTAVSTVYYSKMNSDGTIGTWQTNAQALPAIRLGAVALFNNGFMYVVGGCTDTTCTTNAQSTIYYGKVQADGSIAGVATAAWTTNANSLLNARGMGTATFANGYLYYIGGSGNTNGTPSTAGAKQDGVYAQVNGDGSISPFSGTTGGSVTNLPAARLQHTSVIANGYIYVLAGCSAQASGACSAASAVSTVYYSKLNSDGTLGCSTTGAADSWCTNTNALPVNRAAHTSIVTNGYIYVIGGFDASARTATTFYASTARVSIAGALDLVGLSAQGLSDFSGGGALTAGNIRGVGDLRIDGYADFNNGISVDSAITVNAVSASAGQKIFNINNSSSNSIFSIQHMSANFGSLATAGAFVQKNSYWGQEYNIGNAGALSMTGSATPFACSWGRGDSGGHINGATAACGAAASASSGQGDMTLSASLQSATTDACAPSQPAGANGVERITATAVNTASHSAVCAEYPTGGAAGVSSNFLTATNLPVMTMKIKPTTFANNTGIRFFAGMWSGGIPAIATTIPGTAASTWGVYFTNCTATTPTCANTTLQGWVVSASTTLIGSVSCPSSLTVGSFAYLKIEFRTATEVHFYADVNTADGINEVECGTGVSGAVNAGAMTPFVEAVNSVNATGATTVLDVDYLRTWQDDNLPAAESSTADSSATVPTEAPLSLDPQSADTVAAAGPDPENTFFSFLAASSEDTVFTHDVYVKGTLYADKIKANQIEGLEIFTDKINSLEQQLSREEGQQSAAQTDASNQPPVNPDPNGHVLGTSSITFQNATIVLDLNVVGTLTANGGLTVGGPADFQGETRFQKLVSFMDRVVFRQDISFEGRPTFNNDTAGFATIYPTQQEVKVKFDKPYDQLPVVTVSVNNGQFVTYTYKDLTNEGFTIVIKDPATDQVNFSWTALSIKDAKTAQVPVDNYLEPSH